MLDILDESLLDLFENLHARGTEVEEILPHEPPAFFVDRMTSCKKSKAKSRFG